MAKKLVQCNVPKEDLWKINVTSNKKMVGTMELNVQDTMFNKTPYSFVYEYSIKNRIVLECVVVSPDGNPYTGNFECTLTLGEYVCIGKGSSKKEAKHAAALTLMKKMIYDKPQLLNNEFKGFDLGNEDSTTDVLFSAVNILDEICKCSELGLPTFKMLKEEVKAHSRQYTVACRVSDMVEMATHKTETQAKNLAAKKMATELMAVEDSRLLEMKANQTKVSDNSFEVLEKVELIKSKRAKAPESDYNVQHSNLHLVFKETKWFDTTTLKEVTDQFCRDGNRLIIKEALNVLNKIVEECGMDLRVQSFNEECKMNEHICFLTIENVYPAVVGVGIDVEADVAKYNAAVNLLIRMCILYK